jgi:hypothetical protein
MTDVDTATRATRTSVPSTLVQAAAATLLALAARAVSFLPALTTNIHGSGAAVTFPHGYAVLLIVTVVVTASLANHVHLTEWGIALIAATLAGAAVGLPLAARR